MKALMICLGNICRSPMAEGIVRKLAADRGIDIQLDSCGTNGFHDGESPDSRATRNLKEKGIDISDLHSRKFQSTDFDKFDVLFTMDLSNRDTILALAKTESDRKKVKLFLNEAHPGKDLPVPDPYYGGDEGFESVYQLINEAAAAFLNKIEHE
jgi:protein-tyrosine phosphatase